MIATIVFLESILYFFFFFFNDTATTEIYTLSLHDALPISFPLSGVRIILSRQHAPLINTLLQQGGGDRKSTRLNSSHLVISYAVFCLKKKKRENNLPYSSIRSSTSSVLCTHAVSITLGSAM